MFEVFPLFPSTVASDIIKENISKLHEIKELTFIKTNEEGSSITETFNLLDSYPKEKDIIYKYFNHYKNSILMLQNTDFKISTSWATKCETGESSGLHNHKNCVFSAVIYLDNIVDGGDLVFLDTGIKPTSTLLNTPTSQNYYNSDLFYIKPEKCKIVIFPSYLYHKISTYTGVSPRYSIAMNFVPIGDIGIGDSRVFYDSIV